jgi:hypothetical protein
MPGSSNPAVETNPRRTLTTPKVQKAIAKLYEDLVEPLATHAKSRVTMAFITPHPTCARLLMP